LLKPARKLLTAALSSKYYYAEFELLEPLAREPLPLQFFNVWVPGVDELPMSISQYNGAKGVVSIIFKVVGKGTKALSEHRGFVGLKGPLGNGLDPCSYSKLLFIAGGVGIAPLPFLSEYASLCGVTVDVVWGVRSGSMLFDIRRFAKHVREVNYATEDCSAGFCGTASSLAAKLLSKSGEWDVVVAAGPLAMLRDLCVFAGTGRDLYVSVDAIVKCGLGACGSCTLKPHPKLLCVDGPVFKCNEVIEYLNRQP